MAKKHIPNIEIFETPPRVYTETELQNFHIKIQKFWDPPQEVNLQGGWSGTAQKFRHEDLHVAYGSARKVQHGKGFVYLYNSRHKEFQNLWEQYVEWRQKQDWIETERAKEMTNADAQLNNW